MMEQGNWSQVAAVITFYRTRQMKGSTLEILGIMSDIYQKELTNKVKNRFFQQMVCWQKMYEKYMYVRFLLRRMELGMPESEYEGLVSAIKRYIYSLLEVGNIEQAESMLCVWNDMNYLSDYCFVMGLVFMKKGELDRAKYYFEEATKNMRFLKMEQIHIFRTIILA